MMSLKTCPPPNHLVSYLNGKLNEEKSDEILTHLADCTECLSALDTLDTSSDDLLAQLPAIGSECRFTEEPSFRLARDRAHKVFLSHSQLLENMPEQLGEYSIRRELGSGGMGRVFLATHTKLNRDVALKIISHHRIADARFRNRFESEMRSIGALTHPNIVAAYDAREIDGLTMLVTEYVDGMDLSRMVSVLGKISVADACEIVCQVAKAIDHISENGLVHRDIKPSNIMLDLRGTVKLLDLGIARFQNEDAAGGLTLTGQTIGSPDYVAPEQVQGWERVDTRADIYSLGCTLFKLVSGQCVFGGREFATVFDKLSAHAQRPAPSLSKSLPDAPALLTKVVAKMLAKAPSDRPLNGKELIRMLEPLTRGADLRALIERALAEHVSSSSSQRSPFEQNLPHKSASTGSLPKTRSWMQRTNPYGVAIASGFFGAFIGFLLGVLVTITQPDGTKVQIQAPTGSQVEITKSPEDKVAPPTFPQSVTRASTPVSLPLSIEESAKQSEPFMFAILANGLSGEELAAARRTLSQGMAQSEPTSRYRWVPLELSVSAPITAQYKSTGKSQEQSAGHYALIQLADCLTWRELKDQVLFKPSATDLHIEFSEGVGKRMLEITQRNLGNQCAFILNGKIIMSPILNAPIRNEAVVSTSDKEFDAIKRALSFLTESPKDQATTQAGASREKLSLLSKGLLNYEARFKGLPPSRLTFRYEFQDGKEVKVSTKPYSWRIAILPFIGHQEIYDAYHFDEEWDSDANLKLAEKMPTVFRSPYAPNLSSIFTNFLSVVGENAGMSFSIETPISKITDGTAYTISIIECDSNYVWTDPQDIPIELIAQIPFFKEQPLHFATISSDVYGMFPLNMKLLKALATRDAGEVEPANEDWQDFKK